MQLQLQHTARLIGVCLVVVFALTGQTPAPRKGAAPAAPVAKCKGADTRPCTTRQVEALSDAVYAAKRQHDAVALVKSLTLASADGTLKCDQSDGTPCTAAQWDGVKEVGLAQQTYITYSSAKAAPAK